MTFQCAAGASRCPSRLALASPSCCASRSQARFAAQASPPGRPLPPAGRDARSGNGCAAPRVPPPSPPSAMPAARWEPQIGLAGHGRGGHLEVVRTREDDVRYGCSLRWLPCRMQSSRSRGLPGSMTCGKGTASTCPITWRSRLSSTRAACSMSAAVRVPSRACWPNVALRSSGWTRPQRHWT